MPLILPATLDTAAAPTLIDTLRDVLAGGTAVELDGAQVTSVGQACLQALAAAAIAARSVGRTFAVASPSDELRAGIGIAGLASLLL